MELPFEAMIRKELAKKSYMPFLIRLENASVSLDRDMRSWSKLGDSVRI
jgi:hypothetical protein